tara:strand:+ start:252 stop:365 length:114 start_codon:yes stop_codon:yes gene_type:complete
MAKGAPDQNSFFGYFILVFLIIPGFVVDDKNNFSFLK